MRSNLSRSVIPSNFNEAERLQIEIQCLLGAWNYDALDVYAVRLALGEALTNAIKHGNNLDPAKNVSIVYRITGDQFDITVEDEGAGYNPEAVADPLALENLDRLCGRGLFLMRHYMSQVVVHPPGNRVTMSRVRKGRKGISSLFTTCAEKGRRCSASPSSL